MSAHAGAADATDERVGQVLAGRRQLTSIAFTNGCYSPLGAAAIGSSAGASISCLTELILAGSTLHDDGAAAFASAYARALTRLSTAALQLLDVSQTGITAAGLERILGAVSPYVPALSTLRASHNRLGRDAALTLTRFVRRCGVEALEVADAELGDCGAAALGGVFSSEARSPRAGGSSAASTAAPPLRLRRLDLSGNGLTDAGAEALFNGISGHLQARESAEDRDSRGAGEPVAVAACPLQALLLARNSLTGASISHLCELLSSGAVNLTELGLSGNDLAAADVAAAVAVAADSKSLRVLRLGGASSDATVVAAAAELLAVNNVLQVLDISPNEEKGRRLLGVPRELASLRRALASAAAAAAGNTSLFELSLGILARTPGADDAVQAITSATTTNSRLAAAAEAAAAGERSRSDSDEAKSDETRSRAKAEAGSGKNRRKPNSATIDGANSSSGSRRDTRIPAGGGGGDQERPPPPPLPPLEAAAESDIRELRRDYVESVAALSGGLRALLPKMARPQELGANDVSHFGNEATLEAEAAGDTSPRLDGAALAALQEQVWGLQRRLEEPSVGGGNREGAASDFARDAAGSPMDAANGGGGGDDDSCWSEDEETEPAAGAPPPIPTDAASINSDALLGQRRARKPSGAPATTAAAAAAAAPRVFHETEVLAVAQLAAARAVAAARRQWEGERSRAWEALASRCVAVAAAAAEAEVGQAESRLQVQLEQALEEARSATAGPAGAAAPSPRDEAGEPLPLHVEKRLLVVENALGLTGGASAGGGGNGDGGSNGLAALRSALRNEISAELRQEFADAEVARKIDYARLDGSIRSLTASVAREQLSSLKLIETLIGSTAASESADDLRSPAVAAAARQQAAPADSAVIRAAPARRRGGTQNQRRDSFRL